MKRACALLVLAAAAWAGARLYVSLFPLAAHGAAIAWTLRAGGVKQRRGAGLSLLLRDTRRGARPGQCIVFVHGLGDTAATWRRLLLDEAGARVPGGLLLVAPDLPGTEASAPARDYSLPAQADALRAALEPLCPRWTVVGNSLGGWIALWLARRWPEGVDRLVLLAPAGLKDPSGVSEASARELAEPTAEVMERFNGKVTHKLRKVPPRVFGQMAARLRALPVRATLEAIREEHFLDGALSELRVPTVVLWGESDGVIPVTQAERFAAIPQARVLRIPECGHLPQAECPGPVRATLYGP